MSEYEKQKKDKIKREEEMERQAEERKIQQKEKVMGQIQLILQVEEGYPLESPVSLVSHTIVT